MAMNQCAHGGCKNPIRAGQTYCYRHGGMSAAELDAQNSGASGPRPLTNAAHHELLTRREVARRSAAWPLMSNPPAPRPALSVMDVQAMDYSRNLPIHHDTAQAVLGAVRESTGVRHNDAPSAAARNREKVHEIADRLRDTLGSERVNVVRMTGLARSTHQIARTVAPTFSHDVILLDRGTDEEVIVDPFVAAFAPVPRDRADSPVLAFPDSGLGVSPYADGTFIGTRQEYGSNAYFQWQSVALVS